MLIFLFQATHFFFEHLQHTRPCDIHFGDGHLKPFRNDRSGNAFVGGEMPCLPCDRLDSQLNAKRCSSKQFHLPCSFVFLQQQFGRILLIGGIKTKLRTSAAGSFLPALYQIQSDMTSYRFQPSAKPTSLRTVFKLLKFSDQLHQNQLSRIGGV